ncbi:MAG: cadherin-like domain-containing protein [Bacteroidales bacterium]|nr:cadherin-like domain-containing protein [Bacteroidales bacterium]
MSQTGLGFVDITKPPFNADPTGQADATSAIQTAINLYLGSTETIYFPEGTYKVSGTIQWQQYKDQSNPSAGTRPMSRLVLQGAGMYKTTIKLVNGASGFGNPDVPKAVIVTDGDFGIGNQAFENFIKNLTVDVGSANPGAIAIHYRGCNMTGMEYIRVKSSDAQHAGYCGIYLWDKETGVGYFRHVEIDGFRYGIMSNEKWKEVGFEQIKMRNQTIAGVYNTRQPISFNNLDFAGNVPFMEQNSANSVGLINNARIEYTGNGQANAIVNINDAKLFVRHTQFIGWDTAIVNHNAQADYTGIAIGATEWVSHPRLRNNSCSDTTSLNLPIVMAPEFHTNNFSKWANVLDFGVANEDNSTDLSAALQAAINSGAEYINVPKGVYNIATTVSITGNVRKINFNYSRIRTVAPYFVVESGNNNWLEFNGTNHGCVIIENLDYSKMRWDGPDQDPAQNVILFAHKSADTVVLRHHLGGTAGHGDPIYLASNGAGPFFLEEGNLAGMIFAPGQRAWIRGNDGIEHPGFGRYYCDNSHLWLFACSQESGGFGMQAHNGSNIEALGYSIYRRRGGIEDKAVFHIVNSNFSGTFAESEVYPWDTPYSIYVHDEQDGVVKALYNQHSYSRIDTNYDGSAPLFTTYAQCVQPNNIPLGPNSLSIRNPFYFRNILTWQNPANNDQGMLLERRVTGGTWAQVASLSRNTRQFIDESVEPETSYEYRVRSFNDIGNSPYSNVASINTKPLAENLKAHYTFENNASDQTSNGNHGVLFGGATFTTDARQGTKSLQLNGSDAFVRLGNPQANGVFHESGNARTIAMWIKCESVADDHVQFLFEQGSNQNGLALKLSFNELNRLNPKDNFNQFDVQLESVAIKDNARSEIRSVGYRSDDWRHVALVFDGTQGAGRLKFYVDGKLRGEGATRSDFKADNEYGALGARYMSAAFNQGTSNSAGLFFKGLIDDVKIFNAPLSDGLIAQMAGDNFNLSMPDEVDDNYGVKTASLNISDPYKGVLMNDRDFDGKPITPQLLTSPANGTLTFNADGTFNYTPNTGYQGLDVWTYRISNGINWSDEARVTMEVGFVNALLPWYLHHCRLPL